MKNEAAQNSLKSWQKDMDCFLSRIFLRLYLKAAGGDVNTGSDTGTDIDSFTAPDAKILVVDDNEISRMVVQEMMELLRLQIDMEENEAEALEMVA